MSRRDNLPVDKIMYGHKPGKRGERTDKWGKEPIDVKWSMWNGCYKVINGNDRLYYAKQRGDKTIEADIW